MRENFILLLGFQEGVLPVRYLGVPITASRINKADCTTLVNAITAKAQSWTHRFLSFAGRVQLIRSVLHAIQIYWASVFVLPRAVLDRIEQVLRQFLWKGPELGTGGAKIMWEDVCLPRDEGGLGIRRLREWNKAAMLEHIWILFTDKESLWCKWIHSTFLKNKNFWVVSKPTFCSWAWKKILDLHQECQSMFRWIVGDGRTVSFWFDNWHPKGPLYQLFSDVDIYRSGLKRDAVVADFFVYCGAPSSVLELMASWPEPIQPPNQDIDSFSWLEHHTGIFTVASAWDTFRPKGQKVFWANFVWNGDLLPRAQFLLWLIVKNRLPTQVSLLSYGRIPIDNCPFCSCRPDSIDHLFFGCRVTGALATYWAAKCNIAWRNFSWVDNFQRIIKSLSGFHFYLAISRFAFGALCEIIWKERNNILFRGKKPCLLAMKKRLDVMVRDKALVYSGVLDIPRNRRIQVSWGVNPSIFCNGGL